MSKIEKVEVGRKIGVIKVRGVKTSRRKIVVIKVGGA